MKDYWKLRAEHYNKINWVTNKKLLSKLIKFANLKKKDKVIDVGCGTCILANIMMDKVKTVYAIDKSKSMLSKAKFHSDIFYQEWDIGYNYWLQDYFNKVIARMVFHHINNLKKTFEVCYNLLSKKGWLIIEEGISPSDDKKVLKWTKEIRDLKEKRNHFTIEGLIKHYKKAGFKNIKTKILIKKFSLKNWLNNSWKDKKLFDYIYNKHLNAPNYIKKAYNMKILKEDIILQTKTLLIKGQK